MPDFLADESCDFSVVRALRRAGFDVVAVAEKMPGAPDGQVIEFARSHGRVLLTEDRDFGQLVFAAARASSGVIYVRVPATRRGELPGRIVSLVHSSGAKLAGSFAVVGAQRIRIRTLP